MRDSSSCHDPSASVLAMHQAAERAYAPREEGAPKYARQFADPRVRRGCLHCHNVRELIDEDLRSKGQWYRELAWRYPLPDNVGLILEMDRGNVVHRAPSAELARAPQTSNGSWPLSVR